MADLPTRDELFQRGRSAALTVPGTRISAKEIDRAGSDANLLFAAMALIGQEIVNRAALALSGCFESTARGQRLDRVIFDRKQLPRLPANPATITVSLQRPTAGAGSGTVQGNLPGATPSPTRIQTSTGIVYLITQNVTFGSSDLGPHTVIAQAELAGIASEVSGPQTWTFLDAPFDPTITITNSADAAFASEQEEDGAYLARARSFFPTLRRGTLPAIEFGLRSTPGVASVSAYESVAPGSGFPASSVSAFVLDQLGQANDTLALSADVKLLEYRAAGIPVFIQPGVPQYEKIVFQGLAFDSRIQNDTNAGVALVQTAIVAALNNQLPGQKLERATIVAAAKSIPGTIISNSSLVTPAADLVPGNPNIAFRTRTDLITIDAV